MSEGGAGGVTRRGLDAREQTALGRLVERTAVERQAASVEFVHWAPGPNGGHGLVDDTGADTTARERPDLIVACEVGVGAIDWEPRLHALVERAATGLVLVTDNPHRLGGSVLARRDDGLEMARLLWQLGRVRDCVYLVFPLVIENVAAPTGGMVGPEVARAPGGALVRRTAHLMAYVVDTTPRTPQARRRLRMTGAQRES